ncbi:MAG TPA: hypothetical protein VII58_12255 [Acidobacteriaceae bacterium]
MLTAHSAAAAPPAAVNAAFDDYVRLLEARIAAQHSSTRNFLAPATLRPTPSQASPCIERIAVTGLPGALLHHWRATQFIPNARAADLDRLLRNFDDYPTLFAPQVERANGTPSSPGHVHLGMRLRQRHVLTVVLDAEYDVSFANLDSQHRYSISRSTHIHEIDSPGTSAEHALPPDWEHGFLWRQNTYWSYQEIDGGLLIQVESLSLTRSIPIGIGWAVGPYVESIPRDSLEFTLHRISAALHPAKTAS